jgi:hypothetical protein
VPTGLADRVRHAAKRQRRTRALSTLTAAVLLIAAIGVYVAQRANENRTIVRKPSPAVPINPHAELARLETDARIHLELAERMWAMEEASRMALRPQRVVASPLELIERQRQIAATIIVDQADRHLLALDLKDAAAKEYRQAIALFPNTRAAELARRRLDQLGYQKEG